MKPSEPSTSKTSDIPDQTVRIRKRATYAQHSFKGKKFLGRLDSLKDSEKVHLSNTLKKILPEQSFCHPDQPDTIKSLCEKIISNWDDSQSADISEDVLNDFIRRFISKLRKDHQTNDGPLDKWLEVTKALTPSNKQLEKQLRSAVMVAIEEPIPEYNKQRKQTQNDKVPQPDFAAVYKYLSCAISGAPLPKLSPIDSLLVEDCMQSLTEQIKHLDDGDLRLNLRKIFLFLNKIEGQIPEEDEDDIINQLNKGTIFNPLGINQNLIVPVPPDS